jgi:protein phosphatase
MNAKANWSDYLEYVALSDLGMRRSNNQDSFASVPAADEPTWRRRGHVFIVADGMGAHAAGELASRMAVDGVPLTYYKLPDAPAPDAIRKSVCDANLQINRRGEANPELRGMGTTASVLVFLPQGAIVAHVGDSRVYRLREQLLEQLTFDHSLVWEMSAAGQMSKDDLPQFVPKNIITRSLGPHPEVQVDLEGPFPTQPGDTFLICSDGLTGQVKDEEIGAILGCLPPAEAARVLIDLANLRGGPDNVTVIIARAVGNPSGKADEEPLAVTHNQGELRTQQLMRVVMLVFAAVCLIGALVLFSMQFSLPALVSAAAAVILLVFGLMQSTDPGEPKLRYLKPGASLGKGPYTSTECQVTETFVAELRKLVDQLRDAATEGNWSLDWSKFNAYGRQAEAETTKGDLVEAVRNYGRALRAIMNDLRNQRLKRRPEEPEDGESVLGR